MYVCSFDFVCCVEVEWSINSCFALSFNHMAKPSRRSMSSVKNNTIFGLPFFAVTFFVWGHPSGAGVGGLGVGVGGTTFFDPDTVPFDTCSLICASRPMVQMPLPGWKVKTPHVLFPLHHVQHSSALCFAHVYVFEYGYFIRPLRTDILGAIKKHFITLTVFFPKNAPSAVYPTLVTVCKVHESKCAACVTRGDANDDNRTKRNNDAIFQKSIKYVTYVGEYKIKIINNGLTDSNQV